MNKTYLMLAIISCLTLFTSAAAAQVANGDFEAGGTGWTTTIPTGWMVNFPTSDGNPNGNASIVSRSGDSFGLGCVSQVFTCGDIDDQGICTITFDAMMQWLDSNELAGRLVVYVNGQLMWTARATNEMPWETIEFAVECGTITLDLCLEVDQGNNMWQGRYDNVAAECDVVIENDRINWGSLKSVYK